MTSLHDLQAQVGQVARDLEHNTDPKITFLFLLEELGEAARAFLKEDGYKQSNDRVVETTEQELGDVLYLLLYLAYLKNIDLEAVLTQTITKLSSR